MSQLDAGTPQKVFTPSDILEKLTADHFWFEKEEFEMLDMPDLETMLEAVNSEIAGVEDGHDHDPNDERYKGLIRARYGISSRIDFMKQNELTRGQDMRNRETWMNILQEGYYWGVLRRVEGKEWEEYVANEARKTGRAVDQALHPKRD